MIMSTLGGIIGIILGVGATEMITVAVEFETLVELSSVLLARSFPPFLLFHWRDNSTGVSGASEIVKSTVWLAIISFQLPSGSRIATG